MTVERNFIIFNLGVFLMFSGISGTIALVSSLNVEDGLGTSSLAVAFGSSVIAALFIPLFIEKLGCRIVILIAECCYLIFVLCNVYSSYNLIVGGIFYGVGEATVWTSYPTVASRFASKHSHVGTKSITAYRNHYIGYLFAGVQSSSIFGNAAGALILYIDRSLANRSLNITQRVDFSTCGAHDCQDENITASNLEQYSPAYPGTRYIVIFVFSLFLVVAIVLHFFFLPDDYPSSEQASSQRDRSDSSAKLDKKLSDEKKDGVANENQLIENVQIEINEVSAKRNGFTLFKTSFSETLKVFFTFKQLLVMLLPIYNGMVIGFVIGELTRSYASCILGLDKVAIGAMLFGTTDALLSYVAGRVAGKYGRNLPYLFAFVLDIGNYFFCLYWIVNENNVALLYVLFLSFGVTDGIWQTLINVMYEEYFSVQREIAFNLWNVLVNIGTFTQFAISVHFCVYQKIYILIVLLCLAFLFYGLSQYFYPEKRKTRTKTNSSSADDSSSQ